MTLDRSRGTSSAAVDRAVAWSLVAGGLGVFALVALGVSQGWLDRLDEALLLLLRSDHDTGTPIGWRSLAGMVRDATSLGSFMVLATTVLAVVGFLLVIGAGRRALALLIYTIGGTLLGEAAKHVFSQPRPDVVPHLVEVVTHSFPSAHAMQSATVWFILAMFLARMQASRGARIYLFCVAAILTLAVGASRLYLGVHWPSDILAGWSLGAAWIGACWLIEERWVTRLH